MKHVRTDLLVSAGPFASSPEWAEIQKELATAIRRVVWPPGARRFTIHPESGKRRGEGNGVKPIKDACMLTLHDRFGWNLNRAVKVGAGLGAGRVDAVKELPQGLFALEWETGNISSSHRSLNKMALGLLEHAIVGGALIVPSRDMYVYLTDRVGNVRELEPYYPLWRHLVVGAGVLAVLVVEHDAVSKRVRRIGKGTDGRALI